MRFDVDVSELDLDGIPDLPQAQSKVSAKRAGQRESFEDWYARMAAHYGLRSDPDSHRYDFRAAYEAGVEPDPTGLLPVEFELPERAETPDPQRVITSADELMALPEAQAAELDFTGIPDAAPATAPQVPQTPAGAPETPPAAEWSPDVVEQLDFSGIPDANALTPEQYATAKGAQRRGPKPPTVPPAKPGEARIGVDPGRTGELGFFDFLGGLFEKDETGTTVLSDQGVRMIPFVGSMNDLKIAHEVLEAARRVKAGSRSEQDLAILRDYQERDLDKQRRGTNFWYDVAEVASQLPAYGIEFAATGGVFNTARKATQEALEQIGLGAAAKAAGYVAGAGVQTAAMPHRIAAGTVERMLPTDEHLAEALQTWDDDFLPAFSKAFPDNYVEIFSERTGGAVTRAGSALTKLAPVQRMVGLKRAVMQRWLGMNPGKTATDFLAKVREATGWHGVIGEIFEERVGGGLRAVLPEGARDASARQDPMIRTITGAQKPGMVSETPRMDAAREFGYQLLTEATAFAIPGAAAGAARLATGNIPSAPSDPSDPSEARERIERAERAARAERVARADAPESSVSPGAAVPPDAPVDLAGEATIRPLPDIDPADLDLRDIPDATVEAPSAAEAPTTAEPPVADPSTRAGVPFMITRRMRADLQARGYDDAGIDQMTPQQAHDVLAQPAQQETPTQPEATVEQSVASGEGPISAPPAEPVAPAPAPETTPAAPQKPVEEMTDEELAAAVIADVAAREMAAAAPTPTAPAEATVAPAALTLYHGGPQSGGWWTTDREAAQEYADLNEDASVVEQSFTFRNPATSADVIREAERMGLVDPANERSAYEYVQDEVFGADAQALKDSLAAQGFDAIHFRRGEDFAPSGQEIESFFPLRQPTAAPVADAGAPSAKLHRSVLDILDQGGQVWIRTATQNRGPYTAEHREMFRPSKKAADAGIYVQQGRQSEYVRPEVLFTGEAGETPVRVSEAPATETTQPATEEGAPRADSPSPTASRPVSGARATVGARGNLEVKFSVKPSDDVRDKLKAAGFRWAKRTKAWYAAPTPERQAVVDEIVGGTAPAPAEPVEFNAAGLEQVFGLDPEQAEAAVAIADAMDLPKEKIRLVKGGTPGEGALFQGAETSPARARWYFSNILKALETWQRKGTADQLKAHLKKHAGAELEAEAIGFTAWLEGQQTVTREAAREFVDGAQINVREVTLGDDISHAGVSAWLRRQMYELEHWMYAQYGTDYDVSVTGINPDEGEWNPTLHIFKDGQQIDRSDVPKKLGDRVIGAEVAMRQVDPPKEATKYSQYQVPGGKNYRELLIALPSDRLGGLSELSDAYEEAIRDVNAYVVAHPTSRLENDPDLLWLVRRRDTARDALDQEEKVRTGAYITPHWDEPNVVAHIRMNDREVDGKRVLFVEEIQSDWGQRGRKYGYTPEVERERAALKEEEAKLRVDHRVVRDPKTVERLSEVTQRLRDVSTQLLQSVPDMPFKGNAWKNLALKRLLAYAADHGYEGIAWATGDIQNARYDLSKQVSRVTLENTSGGIGTPAPGPFERGTLNAYDHDGKRVIHQFVSAENVADYIGKDLAEKLVNDSGKPGNSDAGLGSRVRELKGLELKIGGTGMVGFYDRELPNLMNKLVRKWGQKTTTAEVVDTSQRVTPDYSDDAPKGWGLYDPITRDHMLNPDTGAEYRFESREAAQAWLDTKGRLGIGRGQDVHFVSLPLPMREAIRETGLPLFQGKKAAVEFVEGGVALIRAMESPDVSSAAHELAHVARRFLFDRNIPAEQREGISDEDIRTAEQWAGVADGEWGRHTEERFARGFERYLHDGKAPSSRLAALFDKFATWLGRIYRTIQGSGIDVTVTPAMRDVYDKLVTRGLARERKAAVATGPQASGILSPGAAAAQFEARQAILYDGRRGHVADPTTEGDRLRIVLDDASDRVTLVDARKVQSAEEALIGRTAAPAPTPSKRKTKPSPTLSGRDAARAADLQARGKLFWRWFTANNKEGWSPVEGAAVTLEAAPTVSAFVYKMPSEDVARKAEKGWHVIETTSGLSMGTAPTKAKAIQAANEALWKSSPEKIAALIKKASEGRPPKPDISPQAAPASEGRTRKVIPPKKGAISATREADQWREIGQNAAGFTVYENEKGQRSWVEGEFRYAEAVKMIPTRAGMQTEFSRGKDTITVDAAEAKDALARTEKVEDLVEPAPTKSTRQGRPVAVTVEALIARLHESESQAEHYAAMEELAGRFGITDFNEIEALGAAWREAQKTPAPSPTATKRAELDKEKAKLQAEADEIIKQLKARQRNRANTLGVDPEDVVLMVNLLRKYLKMGLIEFRKVALKFQSDYGDDARALDKHLESAWRMLKKEEVSVEEALASDGRIVKGEGADAQDDISDRPGSSAAPGGRASRPAGASGEGALGTLPADADAPVAGPGGRRPAGAGDSQGVLADGTRADAGPGQTAGRPRGPVSARVPGRALSPSGAQHDAGAPPPSYTLTPARVEAILDRGPIQRAKDNVAALRLIKALIAEQRFATADEQDTLAKYVGWGASELANLLADTPNPKWSQTQRDLWEQIRTLLTPEELAAVRGSTPNAHFTFEVYQPIWEALSAAGFHGGRVLEPSIGTGHALGFMHPQVLKESTVTGIELEPLTAAIAQALYPDARVKASGYEQAVVPRDSIDLAIGNVPFGAYGVTDRKFADKPFLTEAIHNYFFAKALTQVRPGGLVVFITTHNTLDAANATAVRRHLMEQADFVGAVRLPNSAFGKGAKTEVVTDVVVLRKLEAGETADNADPFIATRKHPQFRQYRSTWYDEHPELVLGTESTSGSMYGADEYTVEGDGKDLGPRLVDALSSILPAGTYTPVSTTPSETPAWTPPDPGTFKPGELRVDKGRVLQLDAEGQPTDVTPTRKNAKTGKQAVDKGAVARIGRMITVRTALREVIATMRRQDATDRQIAATQKRLRTAYDAFVAKHKALNAPINRRLFADDPEANNLLGLEVLKVSTTPTVLANGKTRLSVSYEVERLADIFTKRTINAPVEITRVETPNDALMASLGTRIGIDWPYMASLTGRPESDLQDALRADGLIFKAPSGAWVLADEYLSGDVVTKLEEAKAAAEDDAAFAANVEALTAVQPTPKTPDQMNISLGAHWIKPEYIQTFLADTLSVEPKDVTVRFLTAGESFSNWEVELDWQATKAAEQHPFAVEYGHKRYTLQNMALDALNLSVPTLSISERLADGSTLTTRYPKETLAARGNLEALRDLWSTWLAEHPVVLEELTDTYNRRFNRTIPRQFDGNHMMPYLRNRGLSLPFDLYPHQLRGIWRALASGNTLLAHEVGAGKTFEMIAIAMEMRRTGRARKPMIAVPTHLLAQWRRDILAAYPDAKLLAFDEKDLAADKRQRAMSRIAFGDWDIVLVPHSSFGLLKVSPDRMKQTLDAIIQEMERVEADVRARKSAGKDSLKKIETERKRIEKKAQKKIAKLRGDGKKDRGLDWEDLGVDALLVDEAHLFKNLFFYTGIDNIRGLSRSESDRALDMYVKVQDINEASGHRNVVFATATPLMNSMAEVYTMQKYLQPAALERIGVEFFDNWYRMFAHALPTTEKRPDGSYTEVMRLRRFRNLDLLYRTVAEIMDYVGWEQMPYLNLPKLKGGKVIVRTTDPHPLYPKLQEWFTRRLAAIAIKPPYYNRRTGEYIAPDRPHPLTGKPTGKPDLVLTVMNDARLAAIDARLVLGDAAEDWAGSRIQTAADDIHAIYKEETPKQGAILVFLDTGTPKDPEQLEFLGDVEIVDTTDGGSIGTEEDVLDDAEGDPDGSELSSDTGFNLYDAIRDALVDRGVPRREIAYIHQARNAVERLELFDAVNNGTVRVMIASTDKGGVGMNIQKRLAATVHLDVPRMLRPGDLRQRDGRILRQGNSYDEVSIIRYVTKGTTDEWLYGLLASKDDMIQRFMRGELLEYEEEDPSTMSLEEAQVRASGDPRGIELTTLRSQINRLEAQAMAAERSVLNAKRQLVDSNTKIKGLEADLTKAERWIKSGGFVELSGDAFRVEVDGKSYTKPSEAKQALYDATERLVTQPDVRVPIAVFPGGVTVTATVQHVGSKKDNFYTYSMDFEPHGGKYKSVYLDQPKDFLGAFGTGVNVMAQLVNRYNEMALRPQELAASIRSERETIERAQAILEHPPEALSKVSEVKARIEALETELKAESAVQEEAAKQAHRDRDAAKTPPPQGPQGGSALPDNRVDIPAPARGMTPARQGPDVTLRHDQIIKGLAKAVGNIPIATGKTGRGNRGLFKDVGVIRTKIAGDFRALLHEMGHAIDILVMKWSDTHVRDAIADELKAMGESTSRESYTSKQRRREGAANYFDLWIMDPPRARREAPEYTQVFERFIQSRHPVAQAIADAQSKVQAYLNLTPGEQFDLMIDFNEGRLPEWAQRTTDWAMGTYEDPRTGWDRLVSALSDDKHRLWQMERALEQGHIDVGESAYWLTRMLTGSVRRAEGFIKFSVRDAAGNVMGPGLDAALRPVIHRYKDISRFMVARRALRARERGIETGISETQADATVERFTDDPEVQQAARGIADFRRGFLDYLQSEGFLTSETRRKWELAWGDLYIPFKRIQDRVKDRASGGASLRSHPRTPRFMRRFRGSAQPIADPIRTLLEDVYAGVAAALENKALLEIIQIAEQPGSGPWLEIVPPDQQPVQFNLKTLRQDIVEALTEESGVELEDSVILDPAFMDRMVSIWTPRLLTVGSRRYISAVKPDGSRVIAEVHDEGLWNVLDTMNPHTVSIFIRTLQAPARLLRSTATLNLPWMTRNIIRDVTQASLYSDEAFTPLDWFQGMAAVLAKTEDWQLFLHSLAGQSTFNAQDRDHFKKQLARYSHSKLRRVLNTWVFHPFDTLAALRELSELSTRVGAIRKTLATERAKPEGLTEAGLRRVGVVGREITQDFHKVGSAIREWNRVTAFLAARIGGATRAGEEFKARGGRLVTRLTPYSAFSLALWVLNADDDEYDAIPSHEKRLFHHVPVPQELRDQGWGPFVRIPRPFEYGDMANVLETALDKAVKDDPQWRGRLPLDKEGAWDVALSLAPNAVLAPFEITANYDTFRGRNIISPYDLGLDPELQYNRWTSETAKRIGWAMGVAPWKVDHMLYSYGTSVYTSITSVSDRLLSASGIIPPAPSKGFKGIQGLGTFYSGEAPGRADFDEFYDELERLEGAADSVRVYLKAGDNAKAEARAKEEGLSVRRRGDTWVVMNPRLQTLRATSARLRDYRGGIDAVYKSETMTPSEKKAQLDQYLEEMVNLTRQALGKPILRRTQRRREGLVR